MCKFSIHLQLSNVDNKSTNVFLCIYLVALHSGTGFSLENRLLYIGMVPI